MLWKVLVICLCTGFYTVHVVSGYEYKIDYFEVSLDHFSFAVNQTFKIRYLYNDSYWNRNENGPIFFYTGNEGNIESFADNTGFLWEAAQEFGALVVFAEHRFYGNSIPANFTFSKKNQNPVIGYLTVEQVLADFVKLITWLKKSLNADASPVIAFGGSYGGQLTAYLRMKYPHVVQGGLASSAPLFLTAANCELHDKGLASVFSAINPECTKSIRKSWSALKNIGGSEKGRSWLTNAWQLCDPLEKRDNVTTVINWLQSMYSLLGLANYPYPANFLQDLPAYPVKKFCQNLTDSNVPDEDILTNLYQGVNMYINNTGLTTCFNYTDVDEISASFSEMDNQAFGYQSCTELVDPECDNQVDDFFETNPWDYTDFSDGCEKDYGVKPKPDQINILFGGKHILYASNIIFSNGVLDPWYAYGVLKNVSDSLLAITIEDAAHHLDLRASNPADPESVVQARNFEKTVMRKWIEEFHDNQQRLTTLFPNAR